MAQVINTNVMSLNSQRHLSTSQGALAQSLARLSSGLRINSAKDDAAGLAIAERFTTQIRGMNQAIRNSNDGISLAQVAEGSLQEVANNLQRIRELAVQSRNASNSASDRAALDAEVQQRIAEINRVAAQTEFNGLKVLDGSFTEQVFQVGANFGQTISVDAIAAATGQALGLAGGTLSTYSVTGDAMTDTLGDNELQINDVWIAGSDSAAELAAAITSSGTGVTATAIDATVTNAVSADTAVDAGDITINGIDVGAIASGGGDNDAQATNVRAAINAITAQTGVTATGTGTDVTLTAAGGANITVTIGGTAAEANTGLADGVTRGAVELSSQQEFTITGTFAGLTEGSATATDTEYGAINVRTAESADTVMRVVDEALTLVNGSRADLGAVQNRFESVVANLSTTVENLSASRSRIMDTDFAQETAALSRAQVLQQAGVAMLSQANMTPQNVLALLR